MESIRSQQVRRAQVKRTHVQISEYRSRPCLAASQECCLQRQPRKCRFEPALGPALRRKHYPRHVYMPFPYWRTAACKMGIQVPPLLHVLHCVSHEQNIHAAPCVAACQIAPCIANIDACLLYTYDAADDLTRVHLGGSPTSHTQIHAELHN